MTDEEYFKYIEPLSPAGARRLSEIMDVTHDLDEELGFAIIANDALKKDREVLERLGDVFAGILAEYKAAMNGEAISETWECDLEHAEKVFLECP